MIFSVVAVGAGVSLLAHHSYTEDAVALLHPGACCQGCMDLVAGPGLCSASLILVATRAENVQDLSPAMLVQIAQIIFMILLQLAPFHPEQLSELRAALPELSQVSGGAGRWAEIC